MPDDEIEDDRLLLDIDEVLLTEVLMGWDGDPCECPTCDCPRFRDGTDPVRCPECAVGRHAAGSKGANG